MRTKAINIITNSSKDFSISHLIHKKTLFPTLSHSPKDLKIIKLKKRNSLSLHKKFFSDINNNTTFNKR